MAVMHPKRPTSNNSKAEAQKRLNEIVREIAQDTEDRRKRRPSNPAPPPALRRWLGWLVPKSAR